MNQAEKVWDNMYSQGLAYLDYPRETVVISYHRFKNLLPKKCVALDYGFGSGNHCEFLLVNDGIKELFGIEISQVSIDLTAKRLAKYNVFKKENLFLSDNKAIKTLKNEVDLIIAWNCLYYNKEEDLIKVIDDLYNYLSTGGILIVSLPTQRGTFRKYSDKVLGNTYKINANIPTQEGCLLTIPADEEEFKAYFSKFKILDVGIEDKISSILEDSHSHHYGVFQK